MSARLRAFMRGLASAETAPRPRSALQRPAWFFPGLTARPWHQPRSLEWTARLERAADEIRDEVLALCERDPPAQHPAQDELVAGGTWRAHPLETRAARFEGTLARCPRTTRLVDSIPDRTPLGLTYVSVLEPRTHVRPHVGPTNLRLRCHLALVAPPRCRLRVGRRWREWAPGRCLVFDDSFEHEAENPTDERRIVLIVDVWHPELVPHERAELERAWHGLRGASEARLAEDPSPPPSLVGALAAFAPPAGAGRTCR